jgi:hypothetical protein
MIAPVLRRGLISPLRRRDFGVLAAAARDPKGVIIAKI